MADDRGFSFFAGEAIGGAAKGINRDFRNSLPEASVGGRLPARILTCRKAISGLASQDPRPDLSHGHERIRQNVGPNMNVMVPLLGDCRLESEISAPG